MEKENPNKKNTDSTQFTDDTSSSSSSIPPEIIEELIEEIQSYDMISEKFQIGQKIATGNMGAIYKAYDMKLGRHSVLKIILPSVSKKPEQVLRFINEARITAKLEHPNIVPINDIGIRSNGQVFIAMKYIEGEQLRYIIECIREEKSSYEETYSLFALLTIFRKICDACAFAHSRGIIHRDIKPENIMVGGYGETILVDWGLAKEEDQIDPEEYENKKGKTTLQNIRSTTSQQGSVRGTPAYLSPEQALGLTRDIDQRTDIFLLGSTLYTIATLREPFTGNDVYEVVKNAENCSFIPPELCTPDRHIPDEVCNIIKKAMQYSPEDRYQSVEELCEDIDAFMEGRSVSKERTFSKGELIIREGELGSVAYVILKGRVEVFKNINDLHVKLIVLKEGDCFGEMSMISNAPRSASILALEDTKVVVITKELIERSLKKLPLWMSGVIRALVERLRAATMNVHPLMVSDCNYHVINQLRLLYPLIGSSVMDPSTKSLAIAVSTHDVISEISHNLCLVPDRVTMIFSRLLEIGMLHPFGNNRIVIPNFYLYCKFVDFVAKRQNIASKIPSERMPVFFVNKGELIMSLQDTKKLHEEFDLQEVIPYPSEKIIGCKLSDNIEEKFENLYSRIHSFPDQPPLGK